MFWTKCSGSTFLDQIFSTKCSIWTKCSRPNVLDQLFWTNGRKCYKPQHFLAIGQYSGPGFGGTAAYEADENCTPCGWNRRGKKKILFNRVNKIVWTSVIPFQQLNGFTLKIRVSALGSWTRTAKRKKKGEKNHIVLTQRMTQEINPQNYGAPFVK